MQQRTVFSGFVSGGGGGLNVDVCVEMVELRARIPVEARFSAPVQTGPGAHPASYTMGTCSFPRVKRPGRGVDHPPHLAPRLKTE
jgi:hypothetical protein